MRKRIEIRKCFLALLGILLIGVGVSFNAMAKLGNDPVGIFYDGIRNALGLNQEQLGMASNLVNIVLLVFLFFAGRRYLNIGMEYLNITSGIFEYRLFLRQFLCYKVKNPHWMLEMNILNIVKCFTIKREITIRLIQILS